MEKLLTVPNLGGVTQALVRSKKSLITPSEKGDRTIPAFLTKNDLELYETSDLGFAYVLVRCRELGALKMIDIGEVTVRAWYVEFLRQEWTKKYFDERMEVVKRSKYFGGIDIAQWLNEELAVFTLNDLQILVKEEVERIQQTGRRFKTLMEAGVKLTPYETQLAELEVTREMKLLYQNIRREVFENYKAELKAKLRGQLNSKREIIYKMAEEERKELINRCVATGIMDDLHPDHYLKYLTDYADLIPDDLIKKGQNNGTNRI
jgi:hypothetical protein